MADCWNRKLQYLVSLYLLVPVPFVDGATIDIMSLLQLDGTPD
jgi:hypothetical protein